MNDIPICSNVWPDHLYDMIFHRSALAGPPPDPWKVTSTDAILVALNLYHTAEYVPDPDRGRELRIIALEQLKWATTEFVQQAQAEI
jgi:hypothetical protein